MTDTQCQLCGEFKHRAMTVDAVITRDNSVLLIKRNREPFKGWWSLPGGHVDWDETTDDAIKREVEEETGLQATAVRLLNVYSQPERDPKQKITLAYAVEVTGDPKAGDDADDYKWVALTEIDATEIAFDHKQLIKDAQQI